MNRQVSNFTSIDENQRLKFGEVLFSKRPQSKEDARERWHFLLKEKALEDKNNQKKDFNDALMSTAIILFIIGVFYLIGYLKFS